MGRSSKARTIFDAFLLLRIFVFAAAVPQLMRLKIARVAAILEPGRQPGPVDPDRARKIAAYVDTAIKWGRPLVRPKCLTLGLTRYFFLRRAGMDLSLHFGMAPNGQEEKFLGHCWLVKDGEPYLERKDPRPLYIEMYRISRQDSRKSSHTEAIGRDGRQTFEHP